MNELSKIAAAMEAAGDDRKRRHEAFNAALGKPALFIGDPEDERFGVGYFRVPEGVVAYQRYANGYKEESRWIFDEALIRRLHSLLEVKP